MFLIITSLLDEGRFSIWLTVFKFCVFVAGVPARSRNGTEGMGLPVWCVGTLEGRLVHDIISECKLCQKDFRTMSLHVEWELSC